MVSTIQAWLTELDDYPGWREWKGKRFGHTLYYDDPFATATEKPEDEFQFSDEVAKQHAVVIQYLELMDAVNLLKQCEFYFRKYPFRGLPVTRYNHITNVCEMYFGRFYEIKERLKNYFKAVSAVAPKHRLDTGKFVKAFEKEFERELRARNLAHHHRRFEDVAIDRILLTESISEIHAGKGWKREHLAAYRKLSREWAQRVRRRGAKMDQFLEAIAAATLDSCSFLTNAKAPSSTPPE